MDDDIRTSKAILNYILENCIFAYDELCKVNKELVAGMSLGSNADVNHLGALNRMIQDYLIIRVGGLFDRTEYRANGGNDEVVSFEKLFSTHQGYQKIKSEEIIKYIIEQRHNFVAHTNKSHVENNFPITAKICNSNLKEQLVDLQNLLKD
ncbi:hypothetical protein EPN15_03020 [Patescibacteria group bacterium]|nr:MAG: hypothetical protein EPN15_03020 [Patescibacteria group bacterium]